MFLLVIIVIDLIYKRSDLGIYICQAGMDYLFIKPWHCFAKNFNIYYYKAKR